MSKNKRVISEEEKKLLIAFIDEVFNGDITFDEQENIIYCKCSNQYSDGKCPICNSRSKDVNHT